MDEKLSHVSGPETPPLLEMTIGAALDRAVERWGGREALVARAQSIRLTWAELGAQVDTIAAAFVALGLGARRPDRRLVAQPR